MGERGKDDSSNWKNHGKSAIGVASPVVGLINSRDASAQMIWSEFRSKAIGMLRGFPRTSFIRVDGEDAEAGLLCWLPRRHLRART